MQRRPKTSKLNPRAVTHHSKQIRHKREIWIQIQNLFYRMGSRYRIRSRCEEGLRTDPHVIVFQQGYRVPFAVQQDMQDMHNVGRVRSNLPGLMNPFAADRIWSRLRINAVLIRTTTVLSLEIFDAVSVPLKLARDLGLVELPGAPLAEPRVILLRIQVNDITEDSHQRQEKTKYVMPNKRLAMCTNSRVI
jgi:hypothetical protein